MHQRSKLVIAALSFSLAAFGCTASAADKSAPQAKTPEKVDKQSAKPLADLDKGRLQVLGARKVPGEDKAALSFSVKNVQSKDIDGIRVLYRVTTEPKADAVEISRVQQEFDTHLQPGETIALSIEVPPYQSGSGSFLQAYAVRRGSETMPLPPHWRTETPSPASK
jgi:hypothetical protein